MDFTWNADVNRVVENGIDIAHTSFVVQVRNVFKWGMFDKGSVKRTLRVFREDAAIVEALSPHYLPQTLEAEVSVEQEKFISAWRKVLRTHIEEKGWKIDTAAMKPNLEDKVFTIPSPAGRSNPELRWALETVPMVPPLRGGLSAVDPVEDKPA